MSVPATLSTAVPNKAKITVLSFNKKTVQGAGLTWMKMAWLQSPKGSWSSDCFSPGGPQVIHYNINSLLAPGQ